MLGFRKKQKKISVSHDDTEKILFENLEANYQQKKAIEKPETIPSSDIKKSEENTLNPENVVELVDGSIEAFENILNNLTNKVKILAKSVNSSLTKSYLDSGLSKQNSLIETEES